MLKGALHKVNQEQNLPHVCSAETDAIFGRTHFQLFLVTTVKDAALQAIATYSYSVFLCDSMYLLMQGKNARVQEVMTRYPTNAMCDVQQLKCFRASYM